MAAFVHVIDCRPGEAERSEADCSGDRAGNLYVQYWTYYADSATLRGVPIVGRKGYHEDDWESVQIRVGPDGEHRPARLLPPRLQLREGDLQRGLGRGDRPAQGHRRSARRPRPQRLGPGDPPAPRLRRQPRRQLLGRRPTSSRITPGDAVHLIPLEKIAATGRDLKFAIGAPWLKHAWRDPEAEDTD